MYNQQILRILKIILLIICIQSSSILANNVSILPNTEINLVLKELQEESKIIRDNYGRINDSLAKKLKKTQAKIDAQLPVDKRLDMIILESRLTQSLLLNVKLEQSDLNKIRYLKGLQIMKILYEKTLSLDHHFASVSTFHEINKISNPNNYAEFSSIKDLINSDVDNKQGFQLSAILNSNLYTSIIHSFISIFNNEEKTKNEKSQVIAQMECILDFSLRMHNDLNTIHFETVFLQNNNTEILFDLEKLFKEYTQPIGYTLPLSDCRNTDDWDSVQENLNSYTTKLAFVIQEDFYSTKARRMQINLQFPIDRLIQFITQYNNFIRQSSKFYEKFGIMLSSYENEVACSEKIPDKFKALQTSISAAISKFNTAYKPVEVNGSMLKEVLYGIHEFE
jgi:hypothetical protein